MKKNDFGFYAFLLTLFLTWITLTSCLKCLSSAIFWEHPFNLNVGICFLMWTFVFWWSPCTIFSLYRVNICIHPEKLSFSAVVFWYYKTCSLIYCRSVRTFVAWENIQFMWTGINMNYYDKGFDSWREYFVNNFYFIGIHYE